MHSGRGASPAARRGPRIRSYSIALALLVLGAAALGWGHHERLRRTGARTEPAPLRWVDPAEARLGQVPEWADPRWIERLEQALASRPPFAVGDGASLALLHAELAGLSFVRSVERCEASAEGGLSLELVLRAPVACIPTGGGFSLVDAEGVVLEGSWSLPPRLGRSFLPVIGPLGDRLLLGARPGDWVAEPEHRDALDVALSLAEHLDPDARAALGRVLIDARGARSASVVEPGVRLELEGARLAFFGRSPSCGEPGELPAAAKWRSLVRAVELFQRDPVRHDWVLVDLRWDRPELALRTLPALASADPPREPGAVRRRGPAERSGSQPRVR
jgi:hypothetical protein